MITGKQIREARVLLGMSPVELAEKAGLSESTVRRAEQTEPKKPMSAATAEAIQRTLEAAGMQFPGSKPARPQAPQRAMTITGAQIKAARKLLGWSYATLAKKSRRTILSVSRVELALDQVDPLGLLLDIRCALQAAGIEFTDGDASGVKLGTDPEGSELMSNEIDAVRAKFKAEAMFKKQQILNTADENRRAIEAEKAAEAEKIAKLRAMRLAKDKATSLKAAPKR